MAARRTHGFTLIELMIVVAIIALLSAIAFPAYRSFLEEAANKACMGEAKAYAHVVIAAVIDNDTIPAHNPGRCEPITTPTAADASFTATPTDPGSGTVTCDLVNGGACSL